MRNQRQVPRHDGTHLHLFALQAMPGMRPAMTSRDLSRAHYGRNVRCPVSSLVTPEYGRATFAGIIAGVRVLMAAAGSHGVRQRLLKSNMDTGAKVIIPGAGDFRR